MAEEPGTIYIGVGPNQQNIHYIGDVDYDQANNANGDTGTFIDGKGRPSPLSGVSLPLDRRAFKAPDGQVIQVHRLPGEALYLAEDAVAADALVTANNAYEIHERIVNTRTGNLRKEHWTVGKVITDTAVGGVAANATLVPGQIIPFAAWPRLGPDEVGVLEGFFKVTTADA